MKQKFLHSFTIVAALLSAQSYAQKNTAFAVTGQSKGNYTWNVVREIDLETGEVLRTIYDPMVNKAVKFRAAPGSEIKENLRSATGQGVAATAFDAVHNRLYFTNMRANELSYFDLNAGDINVVVNNNPAFNTGNKFDEGNVVTRMAFGADGVGYAITNDGKSLLRFTTDDKPAISNLGQLIDGRKNGTISIHSQATSWGGDMVGDAYGNLYLVSYRNHVFKINPITRIADYLGAIKGLPAEFTSNGMVVDNNGSVVVTSAISGDNYYRINMSTLQAVAVDKKEEKVFNSSDLANSNLLFQNKIADPLKPLINSSIAKEINVFPNPVANKNFTVQFAKVPVGKYNLVMTDAAGKNVLARALSIGIAGQTERISIPKSAGGGVYLLKLTGADKQTMYSDKIVVQ
jgi:hypothetical protein